MRAMVLAAGLGLRLRPLTLERAKPACPVAGHPLLHFVLERLAAAGVREAVVNTHYLPHTVNAALADFGSATLQVTAIHEPIILGTGGGLKNARRLLEQADTVLLLNGDSLSEVDLAAAVREHRDSEALATMVLRSDPRIERYGAVTVANDGAVIDIANLRGQSGPRSGLFVGTHLLSPRIFAHLPKQAVFCINREAYLPLLSHEPGAVRAHFTTGRFFDLGTPADYLAANWALLDRPGPFALVRRGRHETAPGVWVGEGVTVDPTALLRAPVLLGDGVRVDAGARLGPYVVAGDGAVIVDGVQLDHCVVWDGVTVTTSAANAVFTAGGQTGVDLGSRV